MIMRVAWAFWLLIAVAFLLFVIGSRLDRKPRGALR
jgi:hypothetical protein